MYPAPTPHPWALRGRDAELHCVTRLLDESVHAQDCLVLSGRQGMGKSLLAQAASRMAEATGISVLSIDGAAMRTSGVSLLDAVEAGLRGVGRTHPPTGPGPLPAVNRLLELLRRRRGRQRLLVVVDDTQQLAAADLTLLGLVSRRLASTSTMLLVTTTPENTPLEKAGLPSASLGPLHSRAARLLLADRFMELSDTVADRVISEAAGIPLALVELPAGLTTAQRRGHEPLPFALPLTPRLREAFTADLEALPPNVRRLLQLVAVANPHDLAAALALARRASPQRPPLDEATLDEVERLGVVGRNRVGGVGLLPPFMRGAVIDESDETALEEARGSLTAALTGDPERHAWHLAAEATGPDDTVAELLEAASHAAARRGDPHHSVRLMVRAAELSVSSMDHGRRLLAAAQLRISVTGELEGAARLLSRVGDADAETVDRLGAELTKTQLLLADGAPFDRAQRQLAETLISTTPLPGPSDPATLAAFQLLFYLTLMLARPEPWSTYAGLARQVRPRFGRSQELLGLVLPDVTRADRHAIEDLQTTVDNLHKITDAGEIIRVSVVAFHLDRMAGCRARLLQMARSARQGQATSTGAEAMLRLALDDCFTGQLARAEQSARQGRELTSAIGQQERAWTFDVCLGLVAAMRGDHEQVQHLTDELSTLAGSRAANLLEHHCAHIRGLYALGTGDFESAYQYAISINPAGTLATYTTQAVWSCLDLVEAAAHTGRYAEAAAHVAALQRSGLFRVSPRMALRVSAAAAIAAPDSQAPDMFERALAITGVGRWQFEIARVRFAYGERLHRMRRSNEARPFVTEAYEMFRSLQASPWASRAARAMRATGMPLPLSERPAAPKLTARDRQIAAHAATGMSNREIGARLFMSPRTVSSQLHLIFPKLGVTSRAGLRKALAAATEPPRDVTTTRHPPDEARKDGRADL